MHKNCVGTLEACCAGHMHAIK